MARLSSSDQIEAFRRQQVELAKKIKAAEAKARDRERIDEQRRENLVGRVALQLMTDEPDSAISHELFTRLGQQLTRPADRSLFPALAPLRPAADAPDDRPPTVAAAP